MKIKPHIADGIWPTMITPFDHNNQIDYHALELLIEWYLTNQVDGLFAVCQSSEMLYLTLAERVELARFVVEKVNGRIPVVASGHNSHEMDTQLNELKAMADTGIDALVLVANRMATADQSDDVWRKNLETILEQIPETPMGLYECPAPYNRLLEPEILQWCSKTDRFFFFKDTSCDLTKIKAKLDAIQGTKLKFFNANSATLLESLKMGAAGFSGVMANFHPALYVWLTRNWQQEPRLAEDLQNFLGFTSVIEHQYYPINAKYHCQLEKLPLELYARNKDLAGFKSSFKIEVEQLHNLTQKYLEQFSLA